MEKTTYRKGDRLEWSRAGEKNYCSVLDILRTDAHGQQFADITIDGWIGHQTENVSHYSFRKLEKGEKGYVRY